MNNDIFEETCTRMLAVIRARLEKEILKHLWGEFPEMATLVLPSGSRIQIHHGRSILPAKIYKH